MAGDGREIRPKGDTSTVQCPNKKATSVKGNPTQKTGEIFGNWQKGVKTGRKPHV